MIADDNFDDLLRQPREPRVPDWISQRDDTLTDFAADGLPVKVRVKVCAACKNTLKVCETYTVCATPQFGTAALWDSATGENLRVRDILAANAKTARDSWRAAQNEAAAKRVEPTSEGETVTPIAPGFEGFAVVAARAADRGFLVLPIIPGGKFPPLLKDFQHKATSDLNVIASWAQQYPQANAGAMATPDGHIFLDEDNVPRIHELYREKYGEEYPRTYATESRPGHRQTAWLQTDATRSLGNLPQDSTKEKVMSVRAKNMYVMVAGSIHPDTKQPYRVVDDSAIIPMPDKLVEFVLWLKSERRKEVAAEKEAAKMAKTAEPSTLTLALHPQLVSAIAEGKDEAGNGDGTENDSVYEESDPPILGDDRVYTEPGRNDILSRYAYRRFIQELCSEDELREDVHEFNDRHCSPPLSTGEVDKIIAGKLSMTPIGCGLIHDGQLEPTRPITLANKPLQGTTVEAQMQEIENRQARDPDIEIPKIDFRLLLDKKELARKKASWIEQYVQTASQLSTAPVKWLFDGLLLHESVNILCGDFGSLKSVLALLMSQGMLTNTSFGHRAPFGEPVRVVYVDNENPEAVVMVRLKAMGFLDADGKEIPGFKVWGQWVRNENAGIPRLMDDERLIEDAIRYRNTFYIFDSLSSFTDGEDENDNPRMAVHMRRAKRLARMSAGVLILHHTPKSGKAEWRGATAIIDQSDHATAINCTKSGSSCLIKLSDIRFRACEPWKAQYHVFFDQTWPDGRVGLHIHYKTIDSGLKGDTKRRDDAAGADIAAEISFERPDAEILTQAAGYIAEHYHANGEPLNQTQLAEMCGVTAKRDRTRLFCRNGRQQYWQCTAGTKNALLYYPPDVTIPSAQEIKAAKEEQRRTREAERKRNKRGSEVAVLT